MAPWQAATALAALGFAALGSGTQEADVEFRQYMQRYNKTYASHEEYLVRRAAFAKSAAYVRAENAKGHSYRLETNEFADQTTEEFAAARLGLAAPAHGWQGAAYLGAHEHSGAELPESVDWVEKGAVTDPKNQRTCGSCWAFSSTGALEGRWQIATGTLLSLSEQQLVDCAKDGNNGCGGGLMDHAFEFWESSAVCTEDSYAYTAKDGTCIASNCTEGVPAGGVRGYKDVATDDEAALMEAVAEGPVSVAIEADQMAFQLYAGGVLSKKCGDSLDHGVLIVGYGTSEDGVEYWKVKNSWGASWGEEGYLRMERGSAAGAHGECGIKDRASYPVVDGDGAARSQTIVV